MRMSREIIETLAILLLGFDDGRDIETKKQKLSKVIEIEERKNPDYYNEIINRYHFIDN